ncbi:MAG: NAD(P)/FAD-dependent oxidoreductase [Idiomarina sp.]|nr:NAD(P)/FAD-dependent oxidoreductase [Idiomarina sp.]
MTQHIVVVGGGAGGLELVTRLGRSLGKRNKAKITLIDRSATHVWKPLYHELATGVLNSNLDEVSFQGHAKNHHYRFLRGSMAGLDREKRVVRLAPLFNEDGDEILSSREVAYDYLVMALGSVANDFGIEGVSEHCHFIDTAEQAESFRKSMLDAFLHINDASSKDQRELAINIVGGGATGVELAAELTKASEMLHDYGYTDLEHSRLKIRLIEMAERILPPLSEKVSRKVHQELEKLDVTIHTDTSIGKATKEGLYTNDDQYFEADLHVWAAGIKAPPFLSELGLSTKKNNTIKVHATMQSIDDERIYAFGDCAFCPQGEDDGVPPRAQAAHQQAKHLAKNLIAALAGEPLKDFKYTDRGSLVSLADYDAVGRLMGGLARRGVFMEGVMARLAYASLYRMHQVTIHGFSKTAFTMVADSFNYYLKPRMKLH